MKKREVSSPIVIPDIKFAIPGIANYPLYLQSVGYCGPTSLRMIAGHRGVHYSSDESARLCNATIHGCSPNDLVKALNQFTRATLVSGLDIRELNERVRAGNEVIVNWYPPADYPVTLPGNWEDDHYSVVVGGGDNLLLFAEPITGRFETSVIRNGGSGFLERWFSFEGNELTGNTLERVAIVLD